MGRNTSTSIHDCWGTSFYQLHIFVTPTAKIPSADTIKSFILNCYETDKEKVCNLLLNIPGKISYTIDCWTSPSAKSFLSITAHFINKEWKLQHILLDFIEMFDAHTGQHLKEAFLTGLEQFSIEDKVWFVFLCQFVMILI